MAVHDMTVAIVQKLIALKRQFGTVDSEIKVPANISVPLFQSSKFLGTKLGMNASIAYMWRPTNDSYLKDDNSFGFGCFELRFYLTSNKYQELLFFGGSVIASFYLARINKLAFEMQELIQGGNPNVNEIASKLERCVEIWDKITQENQKIID